MVVTYTKVRLAKMMVKGTKLVVNDELKAASMINNCIKYQSMGTKALAKRIGIPEKCIRVFKRLKHRLED